MRLSFFNPKGSRVVTLAAAAGGGTYDAMLDLGPGASLREKRMPIPLDDPRWDGVWSAKSRRSAEAFQVELAIPWKTLTDAGLERETLAVECQRKTRWGGAKDASLLRLVENGVEIQSIANPPARKFTVRLHFAELDDVAPGERVFDVVLQGRTILSDLDVVRRAGGRHRALVEEIRDVAADRVLDLRLVPKTGALTQRTAPVLSAVELREQ